MPDGRERAGLVEQRVVREDSEMTKALVVYYSWSNGNTKRIALQLQEAIGADIERIETVAPYSGSYDDVVEQAHDEVRRGFSPKIKALSHDASDYDVVAIGTPTWWYTMAPAMKTYLEGAALSGRTVIPFMTNGGWPGHVIKDIESACAGASFGPSMEVQFDSTGGSELVTPKKDVDAWVARVAKSR